MNASDVDAKLATDVLCSNSKLAAVGLKLMEVMEGRYQEIDGRRRRIKVTKETEPWLAQSGA